MVIIAFGAKLSAAVYAQQHRRSILFRRQQGAGRFRAVCDGGSLCFNASNTKILRPAYFRNAAAGRMPIQRLDRASVKYRNIKSAVYMQRTQFPVLILTSVIPQPIRNI